MTQLGCFLFICLSMLCCQTTDSVEIETHKDSVCQYTHVELDFAELSGNNVVNPECAASPEADLPIE